MTGEAFGIPREVIAQRYAAMNQGVQGDMVVNESNPDATIAEAGRREQARFENIVQPMIDSQIEDIQGTELIDDAKERASTAFDNTRAQSARSLSRYGIERNASQRRSFDRNLSHGKALNTVQVIGEARDANFDRRVNVASTLQNSVQGLNSASQQGLLQNIQSRDARNNAYKQAKQQHRQQMIGTGLSIGSTIGMMAVMGLI